MELLIAILMYLHLYATPDMMNDTEFVGAHQSEINQARTIIENNWYQEVEGGVVIDPNVIV